MGLDDYRPERTPLDEYAAKVARRLRKRSIPTGYWSARGHTVSGWQLNSESWSSEKDYGGGVWRENWGLAVSYWVMMAGFGPTLPAANTTHQLLGCPNLLP